jgi:valyl-tRNA synthetase
MSKTKGNVVDPIDITEKYGTDAVRFTLASMASPGTDIAFNESRIEGYRNFANKIWNAARFMFMNIDKASEAGAWKQEELASLVSSTYKLDSAAPLVDRWIEARFQQTAYEVNAALKDYRFDEAANLVYQFFWGDLCAWYIEAVKPRSDFSGSSRAQGQAALNHLVRMFEGSLRLLSPFMPFITEEVWHALWQQKAPAKSIALTRFPLGAELGKAEIAAIDQMEIIKRLIEGIRNRRADLKVAPKEKIAVRIFTQASTQALINSNRDMIEQGAGVDDIEFSPESMAKVPGVQTTNAYEVVVDYERKIDVAAERDRLSKELKKLESEFSNTERQLGNEGFLAKAPAKVVEGLRRRHAELEQLVPKTRVALEELERNSTSGSNGTHG